ncbi:hypothetical protein, partial [Burkholderia sp.]|uniref:hypothetical protein n=1 Tax=Burkholderia sp. TaxID=36773 RepID=UPI00258F0384
RGHVGGKGFRVINHDMILNVRRCAADSRAIPESRHRHVCEASLWALTLAGTQRIAGRGMQKCISRDKR